MSRRPKGNDASRFRALARDLKDGKGKIQAESALKGIQDPYFRSLSLLSIAIHTKVDMEVKLQLIEDSLAEASRTEPLWRRGEVLSYLLRDSSGLEEEPVKRIEEGLLSQIGHFEKGEGLSEAITKIARYLPCTSSMGLLKIASENLEFSGPDMKVIIKNWARRCSKTGPSPDDIMMFISTLSDLQMKAELLGYLHLQILRSDPKNISPHIFASALSACMELEGHDRLSMIAYLSKHAYTHEAIEMLIASIEMLADSTERVKATTYVSSGADRSGNSDLANELIDKALKEAQDVKDRAERNSLKFGIAQDLLRLKRDDLATGILRDLSKGPEKDPIAGLARNLLDRERAVKEEVKVEKMEDVSRPPATSNPVLALYDTYEGSIKQVHLKAIARAAPLCYGFELDLALIGFPMKDLGGLVEKVIRETNIGKGGRFLKMLHQEGRIRLVAASKGSPPKDWTDIGLPVATTSQPDKHRLVSLREARKKAAYAHPKKVTCVIMGLGRQGLPQNLLAFVPYHLELTGKNVPLETATAMGVIAYMMHQA